MSQMKTTLDELTTNQTTEDLVNLETYNRNYPSEHRQKNPKT